jgi:hypothetical protein
MPLSLKSPAGGNLSLEAPATASNYTLTTPDATAVAAYGDAPTGALILPSGTTAQRSGSPSAGNTRFNSTLGVIEIYNGVDWQDITKKLPSTYRLNRSLRFRANSTAYLNRTNVASPTNDKIWTWSGWVKRGNLGSGILVGFVDMSTLYQDVILFATDKIRYVQYVAGTLTAEISTVPLFRDISSWYHIVVAVDTTQATAANRFKLYVNGTRITAFSPETYAAQNQVGYINKASNVVGLGAYPPYLTNAFFDGYLSEVNFIDGQALDPSYFGEYDVLYEKWSPKAYSGTYGTNGYYLKFEDNSAATAAAIGKDSSGNSNNWTPNNISVTAGVTYDSMTDVPTLTSATTANFPTLNPLVPNPNGTPTYRDGNLYVNCVSAANFTAVPATMLLPTTGKWYAEFTAIYVDGSTSILDVGLLDSTDFPTPSGVIGASTKSYAYRNTGSKINNSAATAYGASYVIGNIIGVAFDATAGTLTFYKNNVSQGVAFTGLTARYFFAVGGFNAAQWQCNFGQRPFTYTPPTGFVALNAYNLP